MDRLIIIFSSVLFIVTWTVVIVLFVEETKTTYVAQDHSISEEINLSDKSGESLWAVHSNPEQRNERDRVVSNDLMAEESSDDVKQLTEKFQSIDDSSLDPWREYFSDEEEQRAISINELLNLFGQVNEAVSDS